MKLFSRLINFCSRPKSYITIILILVILLFLPDFFPFPYGPFAFKANANGFPLIDMQINYTSDYAYRLLEGYGSHGRSYYIIQSLTLDFVLPFCMMLFLCSTYFLIFKKIRKPKLLYIFPVAGMLFDYLENICVITMIVNYPLKLYHIATICNIFSILKGGAGIVCYLIIVIGLILMTAKHLKIKDTNN